MTKVWTLFEYGPKKRFGRGIKKGKEISTFDDNDAAANYIQRELGVPVTSEFLAAYDNEVLRLPGGKYGVDVYYVMG